MNVVFVCEVGSEIVDRIIPHRIRIITRLYGLYGTSEALYVYTVLYTVVVYRILYGLPALPVSHTQPRMPRFREHAHAWPHATLRPQGTGRKTRCLH
jgi:hypothetical protein